MLRKEMLLILTCVIGGASLHARKNNVAKNLKHMSRDDLRTHDQKLTKQLDGYLQEDENGDFAGMQPGRTKSLDQNIHDTARKLKHVLQERIDRLNEIISEHKSDHSNHSDQKKLHGNSRYHASSKNGKHDNASQRVTPHRNNKHGTNNIETKPGLVTAEASKMVSQKR